MGMVADNYSRRIAGAEVPPMYTFRIMNKAGETLWVEINAVKVMWEAKPSVLCIIRDITPQKRLESQLLQAQKMDAIGTLAGGIAHDFNNILQAILGFTQMLLNEHQEDDLERERLKEIETAALKAEGVLRFQTENIVLDEYFARVFQWAKPGNYVLLTVSDTGQGMSKHVLEHIFEPFYTTKEKGKGTGLGLAMVYGIVKNHGGHIVCESVPGNGTVFKIYLPALMIGTEAREEARDRKAVGGGNETILVSSGFSPNGIPEDMLKAGAKGLIRKPFHMEHILTQVRTLLDGER